MEQIDHSISDEARLLADEIQEDLYLTLECSNTEENLRRALLCIQKALDAAYERGRRADGAFAAHIHAGEGSHG